MEKRKWCVYKHTTPSNKVYIGITSRKPEIRWDYGCGYTTNNYFKRAIKKYGWENIKHEILFDNLTQEDANLKEIELIKFYNSKNPNYGYNLTDGGGGICGYKLSEEAKRKISEGNKGKIITKEQVEKWRIKMKDYRPSKETIEKVRLKTLGQKRSLETRKALSKSKLGNKNPMYGKHHTEESKNKMRNKLVNKIVTQETRNKLSDLQKGRLKSEETKQKLRESVSKYLSTHYINTRAKKVLCIETGILYKSMSNAEKITGLNRRKICECCEGKSESFGGYHWRFIDL